MRLPSIKISLLAIVCIILLDQVSKYWILDYFTAYRGRLSLLPILDFILVWNRGISWGLFNNLGSYNQLIFSFSSGIISFILLIILFKTHDKISAWGLSFIIGGALGNLVDRVRFGAVVDFIYFHWNSWSFPAFNIADTSITIGVIIIVLGEWVTFKHHKEIKK
jgi:signal peptidase II